MYENEWMLYKCLYCELLNNYTGEVKNANKAIWCGRLCFPIFGKDQIWDFFLQSKTWTVLSALKGLRDQNCFLLYIVMVYNFFRCLRENIFFSLFFFSLFFFLFPSHVDSRKEVAIKSAGFRKEPCSWQFPLRLSSLLSHEAKRKYVWKCE